jgi:DNA-binding transcriptional regulator YdaS (Cro superfamily)
MAPNRLARHLEDKGMTQTALADRMGVSQALVNQWVTGRRRPNLDSAFAIERATGGAIPASYWLDIGKPPSRRKAG